MRRAFDRFLGGVELAGLVALGLATAYAMTQEIWKMVIVGQVALIDLLLLFLYLEVLEMNVRYLSLGRLPVRFPLYIAMASLARDLILRGGDDSPTHLMMTTLSILVLAIGVVVLQFGQSRYSAKEDRDDTPSS